MYISKTVLSLRISSYIVFVIGILKDVSYSLRNLTGSSLSEIKKIKLLVQLHYTDHNQKFYLLHYK